MHDGVGQALLTPEPARFERRAMGSPLRLTMVGVEASAASAGWEAVSTTVEAVEQALSRFRPSSDLVALDARAGEPAVKPVARWLALALAAADRAHRVTGGTFDPRVFAHLERLGYHGAPLPARAAAGLPARAAVASFADGRWLHLEPRRDRAAVAAPVDLGGIGKGLALRWAFRALHRRLPDLWLPGAGALLEAGGDLVARGAAPQEGPWLVGIESPLAGEEVAVVALDAGAICTSSVAVHAWTSADGMASHHLVDPRTAEPGGAGLLSVTVAGPDPAWAEVRSKTLFLEGAAGIGPRARALGLAAWWIDMDGAIGMTPAARVRTSWVADGS